MLSSHLGQVDFPIGQVTFHFQLPDGQGPKQITKRLYSSETSGGQQKLESCLSEAVKCVFILFFFTGRLQSLKLKY